MTIDERKERIVFFFNNRYVGGIQVCDRDILRMLDGLVTEVQQQTETKCKEALVKQSEEWKKELTRQVNSAMECGDTVTYEPKPLAPKDASFRRFMFGRMNKEKK